MNSRSLTCNRFFLLSPSSVFQPPHPLCLGQKKCECISLIFEKGVRCGWRTKVGPWVVCTQCGAQTVLHRTVRLKPARSALTSVASVNCTEKFYVFVFGKCHSWHRFVNLILVIVFFLDLYSLFSSSYSLKWNFHVPILCTTTFPMQFSLSLDFICLTY